MPTNWLEIVDRISDFHCCSSAKQWNEWFTRFKVLIRMTDFEDLTDRVKTAVLLVKLQGLSEIMNVDVESVGYNELVSRLQEHFNRQKEFPVNLRHAFFKRRQLSNESFVEFARALKTLSEPCNFQGLQDSIVRDVFLLNMYDSSDQIGQLIRSRPDPTLEEAVMIADASLRATRAGGFPVIQGKSLFLHSNVISAGGSDYCTPLKNQQVMRDLSCFFEEPSGAIHSPSRGPETTATLKESTEPSRDSSVDLGSQNNAHCSPEALGPLPRQQNGNVTRSNGFQRSSLAGSNMPSDDRELSFKNVQPMPVPMVGTKPEPLDLTLVVEPKPTPEVEPKPELPKPTQSVEPKSEPPKLMAENTTAITDSAKHIDHPFEMLGRNGAGSRFPPPIPMDEFHDVFVTCKSTKGQIYVCPLKAQACLTKLGKEMDEYYAHEANRKVMRNPNKGMTCATLREGSWYRARVRSYNSYAHTVLLFYTDVGGEGTVDDSNIFVIPKQFFIVPLSTFGISPDSPAGIDVGDILNIKLVREVSTGIWAVERKGPVKRKTTAVVHEPKERPPIPVGKHVDVQVVYNSPEGLVYVCPETLMNEIGEMYEALSIWYSDPTHLIPVKNPVSGAHCAAVYDGAWYRARVLSESRETQTATILYYDFGNQETVNSENLMSLPKHFIDKPPYSFAINPPAGTVMEEGSILEIKLGCQEPNGSWSVDVKGADRKPSGAAAVSSALPENAQPAVSSALLENAQPAVSSALPENAQPAVNSSEGSSECVPLALSHLRIPTNEFSLIEIVYKSPEGKIFAASQMDIGYLEKMHEDLIHVEKPRLQNPNAGVTCLAPFGKETEWYRAHIIKLNRARTLAHIVFLDFGNEATAELQHLMGIPERYRAQPPCAFEIKVLDKVAVEEGVKMCVKPTRQDEYGVWFVEIRDGVPEAKPSGGSVAVAPEARSPPPIPEDCLTTVNVLHSGPEGVFVTTPNCLPLLQEIHVQLQGTERFCLTTKPVVGGLYIAPFDTEFFRVKLLSVTNRDCRVVFIDFGNELELPVTDLRVLPTDMAYELPVFKVSGDVTSDVVVGSELKVRPVYEEDKHSWTIKIDNGENVASVPLPVQPEPTAPIPMNDFTKIRIIYVGSEGIFAAPVDKLDALQFVVDKIDQFPLKPLKEQPVIGGLYVAPFDGAFYRARLLSMNSETCRVVFVDFGNETEIPTSDLKEFPDKLNMDLVTFKISADPTDNPVLSEGMDVHVKPLKLEEDGSWLVTVKVS